MKKNENILSFIVIICACLVAGFFAYKNFNKPKSNIEEVINLNDNDEIILGDTGTCNKGSYYNTNPSCKSVNCSKYSSQSSCNNTYGCCSWSSSTPKPSSSPKPKNCASIGSAGECTGNCTWNYTYGCLQNNVPSNGCGAGRGATAGGGQLKCSACPKNHYSKQGDVQCHYCNGIVSSDGSSCTTCAEGEYIENGKCTKCYGVVAKVSNNSNIITCKKCTITITPQRVVSPTNDSKGKKIGEWKAVNCPTDETEITISVTGAKLTSKSPSKNSSGVIYATGLADCASVSMRVSWDKISDSKTVKVTSKWIDKEDGTFEQRPEYKEDIADFNGDSVMASLGNCTTLQGDDGPYSYCKKYRERGCTQWPSTPVYSYCCVDNGIPGLSKNVFYVEGVKTKSCATYASKKGYPAADYTLLENYDKNKCKAPGSVPGVCTSNPTASLDQTKNATICEDNVNITIPEGVKCSNDSNSSNSFYKIDCDRYVNTKFDYGNDGKTDTERKLYKGEGIPLGINVSTSVKCTYEFFNDNWKKVYDNLINKIKVVDTKLINYVNKGDATGFDKYIKNTILKIKGVNQASLLYDWWRRIEDLKGIVNYYNSYTPTVDSNKEVATVTITTKENGDSIKRNYNLNGIVVDNGKFVKSKVVKKAINVSGLADPYNYELSSVANPTVINLVPKKVCINISTGEEVSVLDSGNCPKNTIDGGNKMYISYDTDVTPDNKPYPIEIKVSNLGNNSSTVINNKCSIKVVEKEYIYRPIDISNPFINDEWKKGINWYSSRYDFTNVIHATTWSEPTYNTIKLSASDIAAIKDSNSKNRNLYPYLGLCDKVAPASQDTITKKLCSLIK